MQLKNFQQQALQNIREKLIEKHHITFRAPTGSGKTFMMANFANQWLQENKNGIIFWLVSSTGNLISQTKQTFANILQVQLNETEEFILSEPATSVNFISWDKINSKENNSIKETENHNFKTRIEQIKDSNIPVLIIVDEAHRNIEAKSSKEIYQQTFATLNPKITYRIDISATPSVEPDVIVPEDDVIEEGLIKEWIILNPQTINNQKIYKKRVKFTDEELIDKALKTQEIITPLTQQYRNYNPLVLIQVESGDKHTSLTAEEIKTYLIDRKKLTEDEIAIWLSENKTPNLENIKKLNSNIKVLIFKVAVATGWDCPRAQILCKLRSTSKKDAFEIQVIGRIRRMIGGKKIQADENEVINACYIFTNDEQYEMEFVNETKGTKSYNRIQESTLKPQFENLILKTGAITAPQSLSAINDIFVSKLSSIKNWNNKKDIDKTILEIARRNSYSKDDDIVKTEKVIIDDLSAVERASIDNFNFTIKNIFNTETINLLFDSTLNFFHNHKINDGKTRSQIYKNSLTFIINNIELISKIAKETKKQCLIISESTIELEDVPLQKIKNFKFKADPNKTNFKTIKNSIYQEFYESNDSLTEGMFLSNVLKTSNIDFMRNGVDERSDFYIKYNVSDNKNKFFPDYLLFPDRKNLNKIRVIEIKGGWKNNKSLNIDQSTSDKISSSNKIFEKINKLPNYDYQINIVRFNQDTNQWYKNNNELDYQDEFDEEHWLLFDINEL